MGERLPAGQTARAAAGAEKSRRSHGSRPMPAMPRRSTSRESGWWSTTTHAFDGVRSPRSPRSPRTPRTPRSARSVGSFGASPRFPQPRQIDSRDSARSLGSSSEGAADFRESQVFGGHSRSLNTMSSSLRLDGQLDHRCAVNLPIEKRQGDGGLSVSVARWLERGSSLPRDFRHIHVRSTSLVVKEKPRRDLAAYAVGDRVTPRPGTQSFTYGGTAQQCNVQSGMIGEVMAAIQGSDGCDVMVDFPMPPTEWDSAPRPMRLWMRASELRLVQVAADVVAQAEAAAAKEAAEVVVAAEPEALHAKLEAAANGLQVMAATDTVEAEATAEQGESTAGTLAPVHSEVELSVEQAAEELAVESQTADAEAAPEREQTAEELGVKSHSAAVGATTTDVDAEATVTQGESNADGTTAAVQDTETEFSVEPEQAAEELAVDSHPTDAEDTAPEDTPATAPDKGAERSVEEAAEQRR